MSSVTGSIPVLEEVKGMLEVNDQMTIDEGTYLVLRSASGAFTCRYPPIPRSWNSLDRPHVALLLPDTNGIFPVFLSQPEVNEQGQPKRLETMDLNKLPIKSIIEIRHANAHYAYYRRDKDSWTKVAEANDPFIVEVFSHGYAPVMMNMMAQF
jgi:hypothetical protein